MAFPDYEEFIAALNAHGVRYLIVGAHAVAYHAHLRATKDLDISPSPWKSSAKPRDGLFTNLSRNPKLSFEL